MKQKPALYVLPHGIEVVGEYAPKGGNRYWRVRIRPHRFFPGVRVWLEDQIASTAAMA